MTEWKVYIFNSRETKCSPMLSSFLMAYQPGNVPTKPTCNFQQQNLEIFRQFYV